MSTVYDINKGINRSVEFKGIKAQYIIYLGAGLVGLLVFFAILYVIGINIYICLLIIVPTGIALVTTVQSMSKKYGEYGLIKKLASKRLPRVIRSFSRNPFLLLKQSKHE